nr:hypothetical protein [Tanacetum cinerariifolium]
MPSEWNTHVMVWRNKPDLDTMSFDDLYNNFKIVEQELKRTTSSSSSSQNMAFVSSSSSTNKVNTAYGVSTTNTQISLASTQVRTDSTQVSTANLSDAIVYAFLASQPNGSQLIHEDLIQIHEDDLEEIDLKWQLALLSMRTRKFFQKTGRKITINESDTVGYDKSKVECFNCHKLGHFTRECRQPRNQDSRNKNQDSSRRTVNVEETASKAMVTVDGDGFHLCYMADDEVPTKMALMAFSNSEVYNDKTCSKTCLKSFETLKTQLDDLRMEFNKSKFNLATYKRGLASVEEQLVFYKKNDQNEGISFVQKDAEIQGRYGHDTKINTASTSITTASINISTAEHVTTVSAPVTNVGVSVSTTEPKVLEGSGKKAKSSGKEVVSKKKTKEEFDQESFKRQKTSERSKLAEEPRDKEAHELSQKELQQMMIIVPVQGMNVEALQTKEGNRHLHAGREGVSIVKWNSHIDAGSKALGGSI